MHPTRRIDPADRPLLAPVVPAIAPSASPLRHVDLQSQGSASTALAAVVNGARTARHEVTKLSKEQRQFTLYSFILQKDLMPMTEASALEWIHHASAFALVAPKFSLLLLDTLESRMRNEDTHVSPPAREHLATSATALREEIGRATTNHISILLKAMKRDDFPDGLPTRLPRETKTFVHGLLMTEYDDEPCEPNSENLLGRVISFLARSMDLVPKTEQRELREMVLEAAFVAIERGSAVIEQAILQNDREGETGQLARHHERAFYFSHNDGCDEWADLDKIKWSLGGEFEGRLEALQEKRRALHNAFDRIEPGSPYATPYALDARLAEIRDSLDLPSLDDLLEMLKSEATYTPDPAILEGVFAEAEVAFAAGAVIATEDLVSLASAAMTCARSFAGSGIDGFIEVDQRASQFKKRIEVANKTSRMRDSLDRSRAKEPGHRLTDFAGISWQEGVDPKMVEEIQSFLLEAWHERATEVFAQVDEADDYVSASDALSAAKGLHAMGKDWELSDDQKTAGAQGESITERRAAAATATVELGDLKNSTWSAYLGEMESALAGGQSPDGPADAKAIRNHAYRLKGLAEDWFSSLGTSNDDREKAQRLSDAFMLLHVQTENADLPRALRIHDVKPWE